jgi:endonuclease/exonuclease/phosphatase family metal-dependent hydrolase
MCQKHHFSNKKPLDDITIRLPQGLLDKNRQLSRMNSLVKKSLLSVLVTPMAILTLIHGPQVHAREPRSPSDAMVTDSHRPMDVKATPFRVVSYNVMLGLSYRLQMKLKTTRGPGIPRSLKLNRYLKQPDILGLQEVCITAGPQIDFLKRSMSEAHSGKKIYAAYATDSGATDKKCSNAQATFSPYPIIDSGRFEFPLVGWRNAALWTDHDITGVTAEFNKNDKLRVYNLHLINRIGKNFKPIKERWIQASALLDHYQSFKQENPDTPVIWLGDFNTLGDLIHPWIKELTVINLMKFFTPSITQYKPTHILSHQLDWIFSDDFAPRDSRVVHLPFSDHFPVVADY